MKRENFGQVLLFWHPHGCLFLCIVLLNVVSMVLKLWRKHQALLKGGQKHNAVLLVLSRRCDSRFYIKKEMYYDF